MKSHGYKTNLHVDDSDPNLYTNERNYKQELSNKPYQAKSEGNKIETNNAEELVGISHKDNLKTNEPCHVKTEFKKKKYEEEGSRLFDEYTS